MGGGREENLNRGGSGGNSGTNGDRDRGEDTLEILVANTLGDDNAGVEERGDTRGGGRGESGTGFEQGGLCTLIHGIFERLVLIIFFNN